MQEINIQDKQKYLELKYPFSSIPLLDEKRYCMHCKKDFLVEKYKVFRSEEGREFICCPNAPVCKGTVLDWYKNG